MDTVPSCKRSFNSSSRPLKYGCAALCVGIVVAIGLILHATVGGLVHLREDQQVLLIKRTSRSVENGPGKVYFNPFVTKAEVRGAMLLSESEYCIVTNSLTGEKRSVAGPTLLFLDSHDEVGDVQSKVVLRANEYVKILEATSGTLRLVKGPEALVLAPTDVLQGDVTAAASLGPNQFVKLVDSATGAVRVEGGEALIFPTATEVMGAVQPKTVLRANQFVRVLEETSGALRIVRGPAAFVPGPTDAVQCDPETAACVQSAHQLQAHQYLKLVDAQTGVARVQSGEQLVFPSPTETVLVGVTDAVNVDSEQAVLVLSKTSGQQRLVTSPGRFFPGAHDEILEIRRLVRVEPHEVAIVQDPSGSYTFHMGNNTAAAAAANHNHNNASANASAVAPLSDDDAAALATAASGAGGSGHGTSFFLPPHHQLVTMAWSSGQAGSAVQVSKVDLRAQYDAFAFTVRTSDNVELDLEGQIFWQVADVPVMIEKTGNPRGDVWYKARSSLLQAVSGVTLEDFMSGFNALVSAAAASDPAFYAERGVTLHTLEVTAFVCKDATTAAVLQEIVQETTNRINRLQQQRSANEVEQEKLAADKLLEEQRRGLVEAQAANARVAALAEQQRQDEVEGARLAAEIEREALRAQLVAAQSGNGLLAAAAEGEAQGSRFAASMESFVGRLNATLPDAAARLELYRHLHDQHVQSAQVETTTKNLGAGSAHLYLTPQDLDLRLYTTPTGATSLA